MTCIVGVISHGNVYIGGDSAGTAGYSRFIRKDKKVFKVGEFVIGCTSSFRMIQLIQFSFNPPKKHEDEDIFRYMCTAFINELRACFRNGGFMERTSEVEKGGTFLVGWRDRLFKIENDYQVCEVERPWQACGCGDDFALGALDAMDETIHAKERIIKALEVASYRSGGVAPPFIIEMT